MVKILAIGDPHGDLIKIKRIPIKNIDLILLTGDLGSANLARKRFFENIKREKKGLGDKTVTKEQMKKERMEIYTSSIKLIKYLKKFAPVYSITGNVGESNKETKIRSKEIGLKLPFLFKDLAKIKNFKIVSNRIIRFKELRIGCLEYFSDVSWVKEFKPKDYKEMMKQSKKETAKARKILKWFDKTDILVCHQPPYGILDKVSSRYNPPKNWIGKHAGSKTILDYIKRYQPKYVFCGHIHEGEGMKKIGKTEVYNLGVAGHKLIKIN